MDASRWQEVEKIFHAALERDLEERAAFLEEACAGDGELAAEVESLLAASAPAEERIGGAVAGALELALEGGEERGQVGAYRIVRKIGEGGLSTVYLAERSDEQYRMSVALKVVKRGMDTADILRRLRQERQILATLKHPNIAQLLDGGTTEDGLPYFVMEYIDGEPIDRYCERLGLDVGERLELFRTACAAVHHAHQSLVIHRDIKPSNLLVGTDGVPKLLDFGIAKLLRPELGMETVAHTVTGLRLLTPDYASPEQVLGRPLTTSTDVYSLGVLLYELLTGRRPYSFDTGRPQEIERVICETDPSSPSGTASEELRRQLTGDLDNIVLMAMRKEPGRRYASVEQLSEDIGRYLGDRPVIARKDTLAYRTGKFVRRHRGGVIAATLVALALIVGIVATTRSMFVAEAERQRAEQHLDEAERITRFLIGLFEISDPGEARGNQVTARRILDEGVARIEFELRDQPLRRAKLMSTMGRVYQNLGLYRRARELLEQALDERRHQSGSENAEVAVSLGEVASVLHLQGDFDTAELLLEEAVEIQRRLYGARHHEIATSVNLQATVALDKGELARSIELYRQALAMRRALVGEGDPKYLESLNDLAEALFEDADLDGAEALFVQALEARRTLLGEEHPESLSTLSNLAEVRRQKGDLKGAEEMFRQVVELRLELYGGEKHNDVAKAYNNLATVLQNQKRHAEAQVLLRKASTILDELGEGDFFDAATFKNNLATSLLALGQAKEAERVLLDVLELRRRMLGERHFQVGYTLYSLAYACEQQGRPQEAIAYGQECIRVLEMSLQPDHFSFSLPLTLLGRVWAEQGDCDTALPLLERAMDLRRHLDAGHTRRQETEDALALCR